MPKIIIIEKTGTLKSLNVKDFTEETIYKKAGIKSGDGFKLQNTWSAEDGLDLSIKLYGKKTGRAGQENKYDFPPPVDEILFFGPCVLIGTDPKTNSVVDLEIDDWEEIYEYLFGGFEDIGTEDSSDDEEDIATDDELDAIQKTTGTVIKQTKQGYAKDGFIVDDDEEDEAYEESDDDSDESDKTPPKKVFTKNKKTAVKQVNPVVQVEPTLNIDDCESELSEESYD